MQFLQGKLLVKISMKALEKVADSVLALTIPDERTISFTAGQLSMTLEIISRTGNKSRKRPVYFTF